MFISRRCKDLVVSLSDFLIIISCSWMPFSVIPIIAHDVYQDLPGFTSKDPSTLPNTGLPWMAVSRGKKQMLEYTLSRSTSDDQTSP